MKKAAFLIYACSFLLNLNAQNLVPNPSFENYEQLPCSWIVYEEEFSAALDDWTMPTLGSSDIFNTLLSTTCYSHAFSTHTSSQGNQAPHSGNIMSSVLTYGSGANSDPGNYREYIQVQLTSPLVVGATYNTEMYVSLMERASQATNNIGMYFSGNQISEYEHADVLEFIPQVNESEIINNTEDWTLLTGSFVADAPYEYLIIGNFFQYYDTDVLFFETEQDNTRYFVDDISVSINDCLVSDDVSMCPSDSVTIYALSETFEGWVTDTISGVIISTESSLTVSPEQTTEYFAYSECSPQSVLITVIDLPTISFPEDTLLCQGESLLLDVTHPNIDSYLWQDNSSGSTLLIEGEGNYWVNMTHQCGTLSEIITVDLDFVPIINLPPDTVLCEGESILLNSEVSNVTYFWHDGSTDSTFLIEQEEVCWVEVSNFCGSIRDSTVVNYIELPEVTLENTTQLCEGETLILDAVFSNNVSYLWQDTSTESTFLVEEEGLYFVEVSNICGTETDSIDIVYYPLPDISLENEISFCFGETFVLDASVDNGEYTWQDESNEPVYHGSESGQYWVTVTVNNCSSSDSTYVYEILCESVLEIPNVISPNNDGVNEKFRPIFSRGIKSMHTVIFNRWGQIIFETENTNIDWSANDVSDGVYFWIIDYTDIFNEEKRLNGTLTVTR